jgi:purine-nucleoside phosphorylase
MLENIIKSVNYLRALTDTVPLVGIVLGTGLGGLVREIRDQVPIPFESIPHFPQPTVQGHAGQLIFGTLSGKPVVAMNGRFHFYEGHNLQEVTFPVRVLKMLGIRLLILSNASGGLNPDFAVGDMMFIEDHINLMQASPLGGPNNEALGPRFPDMSRPYDQHYLDLASGVAARIGIRPRQGVYAGVTGPTFETPAEYRYLRSIGADAVGMSTVPEVIVANHMQLPVFAISVISDLGVEGKIVHITHDDVIDAASHVEPKMTLLIKEMLKEIRF